MIFACVLIAVTVACAAWLLWQQWNEQRARILEGLRTLGSWWHEGYERGLAAVEGWHAWQPGRWPTRPDKTQEADE